MPKSNPLSRSLEQLPERKRRPVNSSAKRAAALGAGKVPVAPSRTGRVLVAAHFAPEVQRQLKILAAEQTTTVQALLAEALNMLFARHHKPEIARLRAER